jgi:hypothetical protein
MNKEKYDFQDHKEFIHSVVLPPLPREKIKMVKTFKGNNSGITKLLNFNLKIFDLKDKMLRAKTQIQDSGLLDGSIEGSNRESSFINSELHRKITVIKKKTGAKLF